MDIKYLSDDILDDAEIIKNDSRESQCYAKDNDFIKVYYSSSRSTYKEKIIEELNSYSNPNCVLPVYKIANNRDCNEFSGYGSMYLKYHYLLSSIIENETLSFKDRITLAKKLCVTIDSLIDNNIVYPDIHADNVMVRDTDLKLVDMDSSLIKGITRDNNYRRGYYTLYANLNSLVLSIVFGIDSTYFPEITIPNQRAFTSHTNKSEAALIDYSLYHSYEVFSPLEHLDNVREEYVRRVKKSLKK